MKSWIAVFPAFISMFYIYWLFLKRDPAPVAKAFLGVYFPIMLSLPLDYVAQIHFLHFNFCQFALIPILFFSFFMRQRPLFTSRSGIKFLDLLVISYVIICVATEYYNTGEGSPEQAYWGSVLYKGILNVWVPYFFAKRLILQNGLGAKFGRTLAICILISLLLSAYEWRMVVNPYAKFSEYFFPDQQDPWVPTYRYDWVRISGPFAHPIWFGMGIGLAFLYNHWLMKNGFWKKRLKNFILGSYLKGFFIGCFLFLGLLLTISRGPLYSTMLSFPFLYMGYTRYKKFYLFSLCIFFVMFAIAGSYIVEEQAGVSRKTASSELESNAIYRLTLLDAYIDYIEQKFWTGWGSTEWPKAASMQSIDNQYIFVFVTHGVFAFATFCMMLFSTILRLFYQGIRMSFRLRRSSSLNFVLTSMLCMLSITYLTVSMAEQVEILTFMILGLSQAFFDCNFKNREYQEVGFC